MATLTLGTIQQLPKLTAQADHCQFALNDDGDIFAVWGGFVTVGTLAARQAEGVLIRRTGDTTWEIPDSGSTTLFGDPALNILSATDSCEKPKVIPAGGKDFIVAWPRTAQGTGACRMETAYVQVPETGAVTILRPSAGQGYVIDPSFAQPYGGRNIHIARKRVPWDYYGDDRRRLAVAVVPHEWSTGTTLVHSYELRLWWVDWNQTPPVITGPVVLVKDLPVDSPTAGGDGRIPPWVQEDDHGNLLLAFEEFLASQRTGKATHEGRMHVRRYVNGGGVPVEQGALLLQGENGDHYQRRPGLADHQQDTDRTESLIWAEFDQLGDVGRIHFSRVAWNGADLVHQDNYVATDLPNELRAAAVMHGHKHRLCVMQLEDPVTTYKLWLLDGATGALTEIVTTGIEPGRPFGQLWKRAEGQWYAPLAFDGPMPPGTNSLVYMTVQAV